MQRTAKTALLIPLLYGAIVAVLNNSLPLLFSYAMQNTGLIGSIEFFSSDPAWVLPVLTHAIPAILCIGYVFLPKSNYETHFINLPIAYSFFGIIMGLLMGTAETVSLAFHATSMGFEIDFFGFAFAYFFSTVFNAVVSFTLAYFMLEAIHRRFVLPRYFPDGFLTKKKGVRKLSTRFLFGITYASTVLPSFLLLWLYVQTVDLYALPIENEMIVFFVVLLAASLFSTLLFRKSFFEQPLQKFSTRIGKLNDGDFDSKIHVITTDTLGELSDSFNEMIDSIQEKTQKILAVQDSVIQGMAIMVESRDNSTGGHIQRTTDCVKVFVHALKKSEPYHAVPLWFFEAVIKAAAMHDLGKIAVDDAILRKPGKFTTEEYGIMKIHSREGARIVENVLANADDEAFKRVAVNVAHYHHERWDGTGYPDKIGGEAIPLEARIMALADVFDALVSKRCYKDSLSFDEAFGIIESSLGTHFDPTLGHLFLQCREPLEDLYTWNF